MDPTRKQVPRVSLVAALLLLVVGVGVGVTAVRADPLRPNARATPTLNGHSSGGMRSAPTTHQPASLAQHNALTAPLPGANQRQVVRDHITFGVNLDRGAVLVGGEGDVAVELVMRSEHSSVPGEHLTTELVVVLDRSGSMGGDKIRFAHAAIHALIDSLGPLDRFALIAFDGSVELPIRPAQATVAMRRRWHSIVDGIAPRGSTDIGAGLEMAASLASPVHASRRVILISDGLPTEGDQTTVGLKRRVAALTESGIVSTIGVGSDFDYQMMTDLANAGAGNYYYLERGSELASVFDAEFTGARQTVAENLIFKLGLPDDIQVTSAGGYEVEGVGTARFIRGGTLSRGQERRFWLSLAIPTDRQGERDLGQFSVSLTRLEQQDAGRLVTRAPTESLVLEGALSVSAVSDEDVFVAAIHKDEWNRFIATERYNRTSALVADALRDGDAQAAQRAIAVLQFQIARVNVKLQSQVAASCLSSLASLQQQVDETFSSPDAYQLRKDRSRSLNWTSNYSRKVGNSTYQRGP